MCIKAGAKVQKTRQRTKFILIYFCFFSHSMFVQYPNVWLFVQ